MKASCWELLEFIAPERYTRSKHFLAMAAHTHMRALHKELLYDDKIINGLKLQTWIQQPKGGTKSLVDVIRSDDTRIFPICYAERW